MDYYIWLLSWRLFEISDYMVVPKNISKIWEKFPPGLFKFPQNFRTYVNFLRILEYIQISSKLLNPFSLKLFLMLGKILPHIFTELCIPKFAWSLLLKILNTYSLKLFPYATPLPHHYVAVPPFLSSHLPRW